MSKPNSAELRQGVGDAPDDAKRNKAKSVCALIFNEEATVIARQTEDAFDPSKKSLIFINEESGQEQTLTVTVNKKIFNGDFDAALMGISSEEHKAAYDFDHS